MPKVERAIIMAAGKGTRLKPLTESIPKPLIKVNGTRMIDSIIDALHQNGIKDIYIVVGYLKEKFYTLTKEYENITLIENPYYDTCNNISSLYVARKYLKNCIILDGDQIINNSNALATDFEHSGYNSVKIESHTDEWLQQTTDDLKVISCSRIGGDKGWQLYSISRWTAADGQRLKKLLEYEFEQKHNHQVYWDDIAMFIYPDKFTLYVRPMSGDDVSEIDNLKELISADKSYNSICRRESNA